MQAIYRVAAATFHEAWRRRFLNAILVFAVLIIGSSWSLAYLQPGAELKLLIDIGLGSIRFFGMLIAIFLGVRLISDEIEKRTIHTILTKPVTRAQFLLGKFFGSLATVFSNLALMGIAFYAVFAFKAPGFMNKQPTDQSAGPAFSTEFIYANIAKAIGLTFVEMMVVTALAIMASTLFSWIMAVVFTFFIYFAGQAADFFKTLGNPQRGTGMFSQVVFNTVYGILPHFEVFDMREAILKGTYVGWDVLAQHVGLGVVYTVLILLVGYLAFMNREV
ncbi:MAG TPA: ABC transporter permease subunit [Armatimonadota bacterium]|jgi:ABC-type transport system involved in multi-copper enzyme maturation permease subunit